MEHVLREDGLQEAMRKAELDTADIVEASALVVGESTDGQSRFAPSYTSRRARLIDMIELRR